MTPRQQHVSESIGAWLWSACWPFLAGLVIGGVVLELMRRRRLRWTWGFLGLPISYVSWFGPGGWRAGVACSVASIVILYQGAAIHREVLALGGEEARGIREAIGPLAFVRLGLAELRTRRSRSRADSLALGRSRHGRTARVPLGTPGHGVHCLIAGATGAGKTVTQAAVVQAHILRGMGAIVIDPKGDERLRSTVASSAAQVGARFSAWSPEGPHIYNPLAHGSVTEIVDKCLAAHEWTEPHYRIATQRLLGHALATMQAAGQWPPTLSGLVEAMRPERLDALAARVGGDLAARVHAYVDGLTPAALGDLGGGRDRLAVLAESGLGPWLDPALGEGAQVDLTAALDAGEVIYMHLDADRYPEASRLLGAALVIDLVGLSAARQGAGAGGVVLIDEFGALVSAQVSRLFARARGAGVSLVLGTQSLADLRAAEGGGDTLTEQVISNVSYTVAHRIADPDSAERLARMAGTEPAWATTQRVDGHGLGLPSGEGTRTRQRDFIVQPDQFKRLRTGEAVVIQPQANPPARIVRVWGPQDARVS